MDVATVTSPVSYKAVFLKPPEDLAFKSRNITYSSVTLVTTQSPPTKPYLLYHLL